MLLRTKLQVHTKLSQQLALSVLIRISFFGARYRPGESSRGGPGTGDRKPPRRSDQAVNLGVRQAEDHGSYSGLPA